MDTGSSNVAVHLGLTHPTLLDWIADGRSPSTCRDYLLVHRPSNLRVLIGSPRCLTPAITEGISGSGALAILDSLKAEGYHFVFVDIGPVIGDLEAAVLQAADRICCVVTPSPSSVQDLYRSVEVLRRMGLSKRIGYVANMVRESCDLSVPMSDLGGTLAAQIPFDLAFQAAENRHEPLSINGRGAPQNAILQLAGSIYPAFATRPMRSGLTAFPWFSRRRHAG
jgi:MinD-like ATPase involved in chromosome partitioning or flagellar assembly